MFSVNKKVRFCVFLYISYRELQVCARAIINFSILLQITASHILRLWVYKLRYASRTCNNRSCTLPVHFILSSFNLYEYFPPRCNAITFRLSFFTLDTVQCSRTVNITFHLQFYCSFRIHHILGEMNYPWKGIIGYSTEGENVHFTFTSTREWIGK